MSMPFSIVHLPDTQHYSDQWPEIFDSQISWITERAVGQNIKAVVHTGDIVEHGDNDQEWINASSALDPLFTADIPLAICPGNHDLDTNPPTRFNQRFGPDKFAGRSWYGGHREDKNDYYYINFEADGYPYMILSMKYSPSRGAGSATEWANTILAANTDKRVILSTHSYLDVDGSYTGSGTNIFNEIVSVNPHIFLVLCGHMHGSYYKRTLVASPDTYVEEVLADFQDEPHPDTGDPCGNGYMRYLVIYP